VEYLAMAARQWTDEQRRLKLKKYACIRYGKNPQGQPVRQVKRLFLKMRLKTGEYTADKVKERKRKAANKRPLYKGGAVFETYGDKRFKWDRSSKYKGAFGCARYAAIREKLKPLI
jgi:hypothetical protein